MRHFLWFLSLLVVGCSPWAEAEKSSSSFEALGSPAPVSRARAFYAMSGEGGERFVLIWLRDVEQNGILMVNAKDGTSTEKRLPAQVGDSPYATLLHQERVLYAVTGGRFWGFDTELGDWILNEKVGDEEAMSFAEGSDGKIYAATYPEGHIMSVDPETGEVIDFGVIHEESWPQYPRALAVADDGWVYSGIGNVASQVVALHLETGDKRALASGEERPRGRGHVFRAVDGNVYGRLGPGGDWQRFLGGEAIPVDQVPEEEPSRSRTGTQEDVFLEFPEGGRVSAFSVADRWFEVEEEKGETPRRVVFDYESKGAYIFPLIVGGDQKIYGSTGHPLRFFRLDPGTGKSESWGFDGSNGHINVFAARGDEIFGGIYAGGILVRYDLQKPILHTRHGENPKILGRAGDTVMRPNALAVHPNGREIVMTGGGGYGATGGGMLIYDLETEKTEILTHEQLVPLHSTHTFVFTPEGELIGGTTISAGTGGVSQATEAVVYVMDWKNRQVLEEVVPVPGEKAVLDLRLGKDGLVYGLTSGGWLFAFDPVKRQMVSVSDMREYGATTGGQSPRVLPMDETGQIYALFRNSIVRVEAVNAENEIRHRLVTKTPAPITTGGVFHGGFLYFSSASELWRYEL